jgi:lipoprotein-releasing system permease protein
MRVVIFLALRQLWERRLLSAIAIMAVMLGVMMLVSIRGIQLGFRNKFLQTIVRVTPQVAITDKKLDVEPPMLAAHYKGPVAAHVAHEINDDRRTRIDRPDEIRRAVTSLDGVRAVAPSITGSAIVTYAATELPCEIRGIDPVNQDRVTEIREYLVDGEWPEFAQSRDGTLLGVGAAQKLGVKVGDTVTMIGPRGVRLTAKVMGTFSFGVQGIDDSRAFVPLHMGQTLLSRPDVVSRIEIRLADPEAADAYAERMQRLFGVETESWQKVNGNLIGLFAVQDISTAFIIGAILIVGGFGILAIQIMIVLQKTRDVALLRATGFKRRDILRMFLMQGATFATIGAFLGCLAGHFLLAGVTAFGKTDHMLVSDDPIMYAYGFGFALAVGLVASILPALRGARVEPVDVLRGMVA